MDDKQVIGEVADFLLVAYFDVPNAHASKRKGLADRLIAYHTSTNNREQRMREALEPFAAVAKLVDTTTTFAPYGDDDRIWVRWGDLKRARTALEE